MLRVVNDHKAIRASGSEPATSAKSHDGHMISTRTKSSFERRRLSVLGLCLHSQLMLGVDGQGGDLHCREEVDAVGRLVARTALNGVGADLKGSLPRPPSLTWVLTHDRYVHQLGYGGKKRKSDLQLMSCFITNS